MPLNYKPAGVAICGLSSTVVPAGPVNFSFAGSNQTPGRDMELWIDGAKMGNYSGATMNAACILLEISASLISGKP